MKKIEKQVLGIDVAKNELVTCYARKYHGVYAKAIVGIDLHTLQIQKTV